MSVRYARPDVSELVFHVYNRTVHPELFTSLKTHEFSSDGYVARVTICEAGHTISLKYRGETLTEVCASIDQSLPQNRRCLARRLRGHRDTSFEFDFGVRYHSSFQLERLDAEVFMNLHEEMTLDCDKANISHRFPSGSRIAPSPLSLIQADLTPRNLLIHTFHTFPEHRAIVKTQSLFEMS